MQEALRLQHKGEEVALLQVAVARSVEVGLPLGLLLRGLARRATSMRDAGKKVSKVPAHIREMAIRSPRVSSAAAAGAGKA